MKALSKKKKKLGILPVPTNREFSTVVARSTWARSFLGNRGVLPSRRLSSLPAPHHSMPPAPGT